MNFIEPLEPRIAPATISGQVLTYTDTDGDLVRVQFSKGTPTPSLFAFDTAFDATGGQQLQKIYLNSLTAFKGANIQVLVTQNGGDGFVNIGAIDATGIDLGRVIVAGDLSRIDVGDANLQTPALKELNVNSLGVAGLGTQGGDQQIASNVQGNLDTLTVHGNLETIQLVITGRLGKATLDGDIVGGSEAGSGLLQAGSAGTISVQNVQGGSAGNAGKIVIDHGASKIAIASLLGGTADNAGRITVGGTLQKFVTTGALVGGDNSGTGSLDVAGNLLSATVGASITGGAGEQSGSVTCGKNLAAFSMPGDLVGGDGASSGRLSAGTMGTIQLGGITGAGSGLDGLFSGSVSAIGNIKSITLAGDLTGGGGNLSGSITTNKTLQSLIIHGGIQSGTGNGSGNITVGTLTQLKVDHDIVGTHENAVNIAAINNIGTVFVGGDVTATNFRANVIDPSGDGYGTDDDRVINSGSATATIKKITIAGSVIGTEETDDHFGITAEWVKQVKIGGVKVTLKTGAHNDLTAIEIGGLSDYSVREVPNSPPG